VGVARADQHRAEAQQLGTVLAPPPAYASPTRRGP
jgi:hypothetical protein